MSRVHLFNVVPRLPAPLERLEELAKNLMWSFDADLFLLFRRIDPALSEETQHNPVLLISRARQERLNELAEDEGFCTTSTKPTTTSRAT